MKSRKSKRYVFISCGILLLAALLAISIFVFQSSNYYSHKKTTYGQSPIFLGSIKCNLKPLSLSLYRNRLYVSYRGSSRVDVFSPKGEYIRSITLLEETQPRTISVGKEKIFVADKTGEVRIFSTKGEFLNFYRFLPEKQAKIKALSVSFNKDQLYVADSGLPGVLVISEVTIYGPVEKGEPVVLTEEGELILTIPEKRFRPRWVTKEWDLENPSYALISPDGRVLVSDTVLDIVKVYTCTGMYAYSFEEIKDGLEKPLSMAYDGLLNPEYEEEEGSFDPSGIREHGRVHVVDKARNEVFVYTTTGNFLFSYGQNKLSSPNGIAVDTEHRLIFIADTGNQRITVWGY